MLLTENTLRTIISTLLKEGQSFDSFLADAEAEVAKTGNESKLIMLDEAAEYLDVEDHDGLKNFIAQQIDVRPMRKFDDFIIKVLYSLYSIDAGIDNWENLIPILDNLYKKNNASITKGYNDLLLQLKLIDPNDTRDIPSKIIKNNLPGAGKDDNDIPKSSIIMFSEMYPEEYNNGVTLLDKLAQGVTSIVDFKTYAGYSTDIINKNISNGNWTPVMKESNITIFKVDGYDAIVAANNIYDFKTAFNRKITRKDGENSDLQYLDYFTDSHFLTDFNPEKKTRKPANWCVKDEDSYNDYISKSNTDNYDMSVDNEFYLILNDNLPVDNPDGACLAVAYNGDRIKDQQINEAATGYVGYDEYITEYLYEATNLKDIIDNHILPYGYDVFYYGSVIRVGSKKSFEIYDENQGGFCLIELAPEYEMVDMLLDITASELDQSYLHVDNVSLNFTEDESYRLYKDMFVVDKSRFKGMSEYEYLSTIKKIISSRSVNSSTGVYPMLTWDMKLRESIKKYLSASGGDISGNISVTRKFNKYIDQLLNFDDKDVEEGELYNYLDMFEKLGIGCINDVKMQTNNEAPELELIIEKTGFYNLLKAPKK